jgi:hypothetical protein
VLALSEAAGRQLRWVVLWSNLLPLGAELRDGDDVFVSLRHRLNGTTEAATARHRWQLWKVGFLRPKVLIDPERNKESAVVFPLRSWTSGGSFEPRPGVVFDLRQTNLLGSTWEWRDGTETPIVTYSWSQLLPIKEVGTVTIRAGAFSHPDLDLLVVLGYVARSLTTGGSG